MAGLFGADGARAGGPRLAPGGPVSGRWRRHGPLVDDPAGLLSLPAGFAYSVIGGIRRDAAGVRRADAVGSGRRGELRPSWRPGQRADRQPCRSAAASLTTCRARPGSPTTRPRRRTTTIEVDREGRRIREYVSLAGTLNNCAAGQVACGHVADVRGGRAHGRRERSRTATCSRSIPHARRPTATRVPIKALGRFAHEAVAVDPERGHDLPDGGYERTEDTSGPQRAPVSLDAAGRGPSARQGRAADARRRRRRAGGAQGRHARGGARPRPVRGHRARHDAPHGVRGGAGP